MNHSAQHRVNARSQVRPKRYKTYSVPRIILNQQKAENVKDDGETSTDFIRKGPELFYQAAEVYTLDKKDSSISSDSCKNKSSREVLGMDVNSTKQDQIFEVDADTLEADTAMQESEVTLEADTAMQESEVNMPEPEIVMAEAETAIPEAEAANDLINFIKHQENLLIDELLQNLDTQNQWTTEEDQESAGLNSEDEDSSCEDTNAEAPVQPGHSMSTKVAVLVIWMYAIMHSLTSDQLSDLLTIINIFLMHKNPAFLSLYRFKNFFSNMKLPAQKHYFCSNCMAAVSLEQKVCSNSKCNMQFNKADSKEYFISLSIESQLQNFFKRSEFKEGLKHRFKRSKKYSQNIEDVYDSVQYKKLYDNNGPLSDPNNMSFILNTDGVPVFKSSKTSMWPIFLMINELPFGMRKSADYMILAGLWCGKTKPNMNIFLSPLQDSLTKLENGLQITLGMESVTIRGFLLAMSCDMPARSTVLNLNQHNGEFCCIKCLQSGKNHRTDAGGNIRVFPYSQEDPTGPERNHDKVMEHAQQAIHSSRHIYGIKGPSVVMFLPHFDTVKGVAIDYMHLVCLGVVRLLLKLWFSVSYSLKSFSLYRFTDIVDSRLVGIRPPYFITRPPRLLADMKFWKAAELRSWLFYYSIPCIHDLLPPNYLYHYCALVEAIFLLSQSSIREKDIQKSEQLLNYFVFMMAHLYDERYLTINVHSLLHLPNTVRELGPLWSLSCFAFEGANGELLKLFHGTQHIDMQIINAVHVYQTLPSISESVSNQSVAYKFVNSLSRHAHVAVNKTCFLGKNYNKVLDMHVQTLICKHVGGVIQDLKFYKRASVRGVTFQSKDYTRVSKRISYCVKYSDNGQFFYGFILWFGEHECSQFACINKATKKNINIFQLNHEDMTPDHHIQNNFMGITMNFINFVEKTKELCITPLKNIFELCLCIEVDDKLIFCEEPNHQEKNL